MSPTSRFNARLAAPAVRATVEFFVRQIIMETCISPRHVQISDSDMSSKTRGPRAPQLEEFWADWGLKMSSLPSDSISAIIVISSAYMNRVTGSVHVRSLSDRAAD
ncbi:hypothetical protein EVAR_96185_1 [Eumeta japonica]|uniref:Uncharacterized protein n=1 Tax=Eumeta variegata TaxID=151549 RepID=A0A4C1VJ12_EUMVA|nr:hypothetical protein EVAR_96185_1 [Eumeta japonica]